MSQGSENRARSTHLTIRLTADERAAIDQAAEDAGLTAGSYARDRLLGGSAPRQVRRPPADRKELARILGELGKIGSNLNQLAHSANVGAVLFSNEIQEALDSLNGPREAILRAMGRTP